MSAATATNSSTSESWSSEELAISVTMGALLLPRPPSSLSRDLSLLLLELFLSLSALPLSISEPCCRKKAGRLKLGGSRADDEAVEAMGALEKDLEEESGGISSEEA